MAGWRGALLGIWVVCLALLLSRPSEAQPYDAGLERHQQTKLPNGLRVFLAEDHRVPLVGISISYPVGRTLDPAGQNGTADLIAALLPAIGTRHLPGGARDLIQAAGFYPWEVKAGARENKTVVELQVPAGAVELALFLEAERMGFASQGVTTGLVEYHREQLIKDYDKQTAGVRAGNMADELVFGPGHPYSRFGLPPQLGQLDLEALRGRVQRLYNVAGATLSVVGDFDPKQLLPAIERTFGRLRGLPNPTVAPPIPKKRDAPVTAELRSPSVNAGVVWAWQTPAYLSADDITLDVAARYLAHRLSQRLAADGKRAGISARQRSLYTSSLFWLYLSVPEGVDRASVERLGREELDAIAAGKVDEQELAIARSSIVGSIASDMDNLVSRASYLSTYASLTGKADGFGRTLGGYLSTDAARLADAVRRNLGKPDATLSLVHDASLKAHTASATPSVTFAPPAIEGELRQSDAPEWYRPPRAVPTPRFDPPRILDQKLGASRLLFLPRAGLPLVKLRVSVNLHGVAALPDIRQLLLVNLLRARPAGRPVLRDRLNDLGATLDASVDHDSLAFVVTTVAERADAAMAVLREALEVERFDSALYKSAREDELKRNDQRKLQDWTRANRWLERLFYPSGHRYHYDLLEVAERGAALKNFEQEQLERYWKDERRADRVVIAIVGPFDAERAQALGKLAVPKFPTNPGPKTKPLVIVAGTRLVDAPGEQDVRVRFRWSVTSWGSSGYVDSLGLRWLFGESREGLPKYLKTHGVSGTADWYANTNSTREDTFVTFAVKVPRAQVEGLFSAVAAYVADLRAGNIGWDAVQEARRQATQWTVEQYVGSHSCMRLLSTHADFAVPASTSEDLYLFSQRIHRASLAKATDVLAPDKAAVLAYGPIADLVEPLAKAGFGPVTLHREGQKP